MTGQPVITDLVEKGVTLEPDHRHVYAVGKVEFLGQTFAFFPALKREDVHVVTAAKHRATVAHPDRVAEAAGFGAESRNDMALSNWAENRVVVGHEEACTFGVEPEAFFTHAKVGVSVRACEIDYSHFRLSP